MNGDLVVIGTPNVNTKHVIEDRFISLIKRSLGDVLGYPVNVRVIIHANGASTPSNGSPAATAGAASNGSPAAPTDEIKPTPGAEISAPAAPMYRDSLPSSAFASNNNAIPLPGG
jgi:chromosomal replication initiator protein